MRREDLAIRSSIEALLGDEELCQRLKDHHNVHYDERLELFKFKVTSTLSVKASMHVIDLNFTN